MRKIAFVCLLWSLFLPGCEDSTAPEGEVTLRLAHVAAGAGAFALIVDGDVVEPAMEAGEAVVLTLPLGRHTVTFEGGGRVAGIDPVYNNPGDWAIILHDPADPGIRVMRRPTISVTSVEVALALLNMIPGSSNLTIGLLGTASAGGLDYYEAGTVGVDEGEYAVFVANADGTETVELGTVHLTADHAFVAVMPDPAGGLAGGFAAF